MQGSAEAAEELWSQHQQAQRLKTEELRERIAQLEQSTLNQKMVKLKARVAQLETQLADASAEQMWWNTQVALARRGNAAHAAEADAEPFFPDDNIEHVNVTRESTLRCGHPRPIVGAGSPEQADGRGAWSGSGAATPGRLRRR